MENEWDTNFLFIKLLKIDEGIDQTSEAGSCDVITVSL